MYIIVTNDSKPQVLLSTISLEVMDKVLNALGVDDYSKWFVSETDLGVMKLSGIVFIDSDGG